MFAVCDFLRVIQATGKSVRSSAVVPIGWLKDDNSKCYWPSTKSNEQFVALAKSNAEPLPIWKTFEVYKIVDLLDSYDEAQKLLEEKVLSTTISDTDNTDQTKKGNQVGDYVDEVLLENAREEDEEHNRRKKKKKNNTDNTDQTKDNQAGDNAEELFLEDAREEEYDDEHNRRKKKKKDKRSKHLADLDQYPPSPMSTTSESDMNFKHEVLTNFQYIRETLNQHAVLLHDLREAKKDTIEVPENTPEYPLRTLADFIFNEEFLEDERHKDYLIKRLSTIGGSGPPQAIRNILKFLLTNENAKSFNWKGNNEKRAFEKTHTMKIIYEVMKKKDAATTDHQIASVVKDWLKYSKARCKQ